MPLRPEEAPKPTGLPWAGGNQQRWADQRKLYQKELDKKSQQNWNFEQASFVLAKFVQAAKNEPMRTTSASKLMPDRSGFRIIMAPEKPKKSASQPCSETSILVKHQS